MTSFNLNYFSKVLSPNTVTGCWARAQHLYLGRTWLHPFIVLVQAETFKAKYPNNNFVVIGPNLITKLLLHKTFEITGITFRWGENLSMPQCSGNSDGLPQPVSFLWGSLDSALQSLRRSSFYSLLLVK